MGRIFQIEAPLTPGTESAMGTGMLDSLRTILHKAITTERGNSLAPVRITKTVAQGLNDLFDKPLCSAEDLAARREGAKRLAELRSRPKQSEAKKREPAPVMVYFEKDRNVRELVKIKEILATLHVEPKLLDVSGDEATIAFVMREAKCERDELPAVFVGGNAIGGFRGLVAKNASGQLKKAIFGE